MRRFINTMLAMIAAYVAGIMTISIIDAGLISAGARTDGHIGGEVLILPLMLLLVYIGYLIAKMYFVNVVSVRVYKKGFLKGTKQYQSYDKD